MPPKVGGAAVHNQNISNPFQDSNDSLQQQQQLQQQWVNVTWMPHTALSQTSHVCLTIHSAQVVLLDDNIRRGSGRTPSDKEWRIQMSIHGLGNLPLAPLSTHSKTATVTKRTRDRMLQTQQQQQKRIIAIQHATHECHWDDWVDLPLRWRDLTRDSFLLLQIQCRRGTTTWGDDGRHDAHSHNDDDDDDDDTVVYHTTIPFFTLYGTLVTGLQKLRLTRGPWTNPTNRNYGLVRDPRTEQEEENRNHDENGDAVWNQVLILDQLSRMELTTDRSGPERNPNNNSHPTPPHGRHHESPHGHHPTFGRNPSVPWLDTMMKERAMQEIQDAYCVDSAVCTGPDQVYRMACWSCL